MRVIRWLVVPVLLFALLGCGLVNGIQQIQQAVTQLPGALTGMPTALGALGTAAAGQASSANATPAAGGLGISLDSVKKMEQSGRYIFTDTTEGGQTVSTAVLTAVAKSDAPDIGDGFTARFIGDPANLSQILVTVPSSENAATAFEAIGLIGDVLSTAVPPDAKPTFIPWVTENYPLVSASGGQQQMTIGNLSFTMKKSGADVILEVDPAS